MADEEDPLGLGGTGRVGPQEIALVGGQDGHILRPHQGDVLDDDLAAHMEPLRQGRARHGLLGVQKHPAYLGSALLSGHGDSSLI